MSIKNDIVEPLTVACRGGGGERGDGPEHPGQGASRVKLQK